MIDIQAYIEESLFTSTSADDAVKKVEARITLPHRPMEVDGYLDYLCTWYTLVVCMQQYHKWAKGSYGQGYKAYFDPSGDEKDVIGLLIEAFLNNYRGKVLELSPDNLLKIETNAYVIDAIPMTGWEAPWDELFELKTGPSADKLRQILYSCLGDRREREDDIVYYERFDANRFLNAILFGLDTIEILKAKNIIAGRSNCTRLNNRLNGDMRYKRSVHKGVRMYFNDLKNMIERNGIVIGPQSLKFMTV